MAGMCSGFARLFAEKLCFSGSIQFNYAAGPPCGGIASNNRVRPTVKQSFTANRAASRSKIENGQISNRSGRFRRDRGL